MFARPAESIRPIAEGHGSCFATDEIMVKGRRVGYAYREEPDVSLDSGWRFMAGDESDEYMNVADNVGLYDVNTVANYDPDIVPLLGAPVGASFVRDAATGRFVEAAEPKVDPFPVVEGTYEMTASWTITLPPGHFRRRTEDGSLVIWRPGVSLWLNVWKDERPLSANDRAREIRKEGAPGAFDLRKEKDGELVRVAYRLLEPSEDDRVAAFYGYVVGRTGHVQMAVYFDDERDVELAKAMWRGVRER